MDVSKLNEKLRTITKEIKTIQDNCKHKKQQIKMTPNGSSPQPRWICNDCDKEISYPSESELNKFFN